MIYPGLVSVTFKNESPEFVRENTMQQLAADADSLRRLLKGKGLLAAGKMP